MKSKVFMMLFGLALVNSALALTVTDGMVMHLDAGTITGVANGAEFGTWGDLSGLGNNAVQTTEGAKPIYVASSSAYNNHAAVQFNNNDWLNLNNSMITVGSFTMFLVGKFDRSTGNDMYLVAGQASSGDGRLRIASYAAQNRLAVRVGNSSDYYLTDAGDRSTDMHVYAINSVSNAWMDSIAKGGAMNTANINPSAFNLGSKNVGEKGFLEGSIAEVVLYNRVLTATEIDSVNAELSTKYIVPEPATIALLGIGAALLKRRK